MKLVGLMIATLCTVGLMADQMLAQQVIYQNSRSKTVVRDNVAPPPPADTVGVTITPIQKPIWFVNDPNDLTRATAPAPVPATKITTETQVIGAPRASSQYSETVTGDDDLNPGGDNGGGGGGGSSGARIRRRASSRSFSRVRTERVRHARSRVSLGGSQG